MKRRTPNAEEMIFCTDSSAFDVHDFLDVMRGVLNSMIRSINDRLRPDNVTFAQCSALAVVLQHGRCPVSTVASELHMTAGSATRLLDRLEAKGLCARSRSIRDQRIVRIEIRPAGAALVNRLAWVIDEVLQMHEVGLAAGERAQLRAMLVSMRINGAESA